MMRWRQLPALRPRSHPGGTLQATAEPCASRDGLPDDQSRRSPGKRWLRWMQSQRKRWAVAGISALLVLVVTALSVAQRGFRPIEIPKEAYAAAAAQASDGEEQNGSTSKYGPAVTALQNELTQALGAVTWPAPNPAIANEPRGGRYERCNDGSPRTIAECTFGKADASRTLMLIGDSTAAFSLEAYTAIADDPANDLRVVSRAMWGCPFADIDQGYGDQTACEAHRAQTVEDIRTVQPDILVVTNTWVDLKGKEPGSHISLDALANGVQQLLDPVSSSVGKIVHVSPPPANATPLTDCLGPNGGPAKCVATSSGEWSKRLAATEQVAKAHDETVVDLRPLVCVGTRCPAFARTTPVKSDATHLDPAYAVKMAPGLLELLTAAKVL